MEQEVQLPSINAINEIEQSSRRRVVVCRGRSCRKYDAEEVFDNFRQSSPLDVDLISVPCLGQCGNGAMVFMESDGTWYSEVHPDEVAKIIEEHIIGNQPVKAMLYPKFHSET